MKVCLLKSLLNAGFSFDELPEYIQRELWNAHGNLFRTVQYYRTEPTEIIPEVNWDE